MRAKNNCTYSGNAHRSNSDRWALFLFFREKVTIRSDDKSDDKADVKMTPEAAEEYKNGAQRIAMPLGSGSIMVVHGPQSVINFVDGKTVVFLANNSQLMRSLDFMGT